MLKSTLIPLLYVLLGNILIAQNIEFKKVLDHKMDVPDYANSEAPYVVYEKFQKDKILRFEDDLVQLFDKDINLIWEVELGHVGKSKDYFYSIEVDENDIYVFQRTKAALVSNIESQISKISADGKIKTLNLSKDLKLSKLLNIEIVNNRLYLISETIERGYNTIDFFYHITLIDGELDGVVKNKTLEKNIPNSEDDYKWHYFGLDQNELVFRANYEPDYDSISPEKQLHDIILNGRKFKVLNVDSALNIVSNQIIQDKGTPYLNSNFTKLPPHFDTSKYEIKVNGYPIGDVWFTPFSDFHGRTSSLILNLKGQDSIRVLKQYYKMKTGNTTPNWNTVNLMVYDVVSDPLNNSVVFMLNDYNRNAYFISLDKDYNVAKIEDFKMGYTQYLKRASISNLSFPFVKHKETHGEQSADYIPTAYDLAMELDKNSVCTIVNFSDYQLLFSDKKSKKNTTVYKVVK